jgi:HrpA-like RNA helicase
MGVRGVKTLLRDVGWYPSWDETSGDADASSDDRTLSCCGCSTELWREWKASDAFSLTGNGSKNTVKIPPRSLLLVDGNGLAFYLHSIAYTRYLRHVHNGAAAAGSVTSVTSFVHSQPSLSCPKVQSIMSDESAVVQCLPCMMPLSWLRSVTKEFVSALRRQDMLVRIYWDGPLRRCKARTDQERQAYRQRQESQLKLFCQHGILPSPKKCPFACQWKNEFPFSKLFLLCVRHALQEEAAATVENGNEESSFLTMIDCTEEADVELALAATGDDNAYVLGYDSDFFFFKDIQYIPLNEISIQTSGVYAFCATRSDLARLLGLEDSRMVDLALLLGNDFVCREMFQHLFDKSEPWIGPRDTVFHLQCNEDLEVKAEDAQAQRAVEFVRCLYNLQNLDDFAPDVNASTDEEGQDMYDMNVLNPTRERAVLSQDDRSMRDAVTRSIQMRLDQSLENETPSRASIEILEAYQQSTAVENISVAMSNIVLVKPTWEEMRAGFYIESCIRQIYRSSMHSWIAKMTPPSKVFHRFKFHKELASKRRVEERARTIVHQGTDATREMEEKEATSQAPVKLPIDEHESTILENIRNNRVTIIHGETGCGKSSRVPVMLLNAPPPDGSLRKVKFFISQPRRIAAKALVERVRACEPELRTKFALRMGHGWKEYETKDTQAIFVTTGYLVRLLANHPERFDDCTHLVIDEVHERSVDTDILCLLCRRLLETNKDIRLVLMSATLATKMYREYFNVPNEPIHVGVRRFPITQFFIEDLEQFGLPSQDAAAISAIKKELESQRCQSPPTSTQLANRLALSARLATIVGTPGASVLIFVPGLAEIISISEYIESFHIAGVRFTCFPIHSDIPFEEQMGAFDEPADNEVKIIIATNAAESSVTLPNVDHVICLGLCRQIIYNQVSHRQMLTPAWISQASATQRAGRTGRVRPGSVYRLYTRHAYDHYFEEFEPGEIVRIPLDNVILMLKQILHEEVKPVFLECLEPPLLDTIDRSFQSLHHWNFITEPDDTADITSLGAFVSSLGVDLLLGSFIGLGIQFGVAAEAIEMAAMMSLPKTPFQLASPMWMSPQQFNETASKTYVAKASMDGGLYSEPLALMNALWDFMETMTKKQSNWIAKHRIAHKRWQQVVASRDSLRKRVASFIGIKEERLQLQAPPRNMPQEKLLILRMLKLWVFSNSVIECSKSSLEMKQDGSVTLSVKGKSGKKLTRELLDQVLSTDLHPYQIVEFNESDQTGVFDTEGAFSLKTFNRTFEPRLLSYASEKNITAIMCYSHDDLFLYVNVSAEGSDAIFGFIQTLDGDSFCEDRYAFRHGATVRRGINERPAGLWTIQEKLNARGDCSGHQKYRKYHLTRNGNYDFGNAVACSIHELNFSQLHSVMTWNFLPQGGGKRKKKTTNVQPFSVSLRGKCKQVSKQDMEDMLGKKGTFIANNREKSSQSIVVHQPPTKLNKTSGDLAVADPLFVDIPEGARVLAMLASSQRKSRCQLRFPVNPENPDSDATFDFSLKQEEVDVSKRWRKINSDNVVYVDDSIPGTAIHTTSDLFAVAANALDLRSGGMRVEALTLLPPNPLFVVIAFLSFGLGIGSEPSWIMAQNEDDHDSSRSKKVSKAYTWLTQRTQMANSREAKDNDSIIINCPINNDFQVIPMIWKKAEVKERLLRAIEFNEQAKLMGESLKCCPDKVNELCQLFDMIDGKTFSLWEQLKEEALTEGNLSRWRHESKTSVSELKYTCRPVADDSVNHSVEKFDTPTISNSLPAPSTERKKGPYGKKKTKMKSADKTPPNECRHEVADKKASGRKGRDLEYHAVRQFSKKIRAQSMEWFSTNLGVGESMPAFPSTNILVLLFQLYKEIALEAPIAGADAQQFSISLDCQHWRVTEYRQKGTCEVWYQASFLNKGIPLLPVVGRGKNKLPKWIKKQNGRPTNIADAEQCVPPNVECSVITESKSGAGLMFGSIQEALQMEAAFWLEQQFCHASKSSTRHWYMHPMDQMIQILRKALPNKGGGTVD